MERKIKIFSFAAVLMLAVSVIGCKHNVTNNTPETCSVTFGVDGTGGTLKAKVDGGEIASGKEVEQGKIITFKATPEANYKVKGWTLDGATIAEAGTNTEYKLTVTKPATVSVNFEAIPKHAITFSVEGTNGTLKAQADGVAETDKSPINVEKGKTVTFTAKASDGYQVKGWTLDGKPITEAGTKETYTLTVTKACTVSVSFTKKTYAVTFNVDGAGGMLKATADGVAETETSPITVEHGKTVTFTAEPSDNYEVDKWTITGGAFETGTGIGGSTTAKVKITTTVNITVSFKLKNYPVTFNVDGAGGTLKATADGVAETETSPITVEHGKTVAFTAAPAAGYRVKGWTLDGTAIAEAGTNTEYTLTVTKPAAVTVSFEPKKALLTLEAGKNTVKVKAKTADGSAITVVGCNETTLASDVVATLTVTDPDRKVELIGDITELNCSGISGNRPLAELDVSGLTALQKLDCQYNKITELDVQGLTALQELNCRTNQIPELNVHDLTKLQKLDCSVNELTALDVSGLTALQELICNNNDQLTALNVQGCTALTKLNCRHNQLKTLNVSDCTALKELNCSSNQLKTLNVQGLIALKELLCLGNKLSTLDVQGLTELQKLDCSGNQLSTLNVQGIATLKELYCEKNQLAILDVSGLTALQKLYCNGSEAHRYLSELNVQGCSALKELRCYQNKLNADAFIKIFNDLPTREVSDGAEAVLYKDRTAYEDNCTDFTQPESLKKAFENARDVKHWKMQKMNGYIEEDI